MANTVRDCVPPYLSAVMAEEAEEMRGHCQRARVWPGLSDVHPKMTAPEKSTLSTVAASKVVDVASESVCALCKRAAMSG